MRSTRLPHGMVNLLRKSSINGENPGLPLCELLVFWYMRVKGNPRKLSICRSVDHAV